MKWNLFNFVTWEIKLKKGTIKIDEKGRCYLDTTREYSIYDSLNYYDSPGIEQVMFTVQPNDKGYLDVIKYEK